MRRTIMTTIAGLVLAVFVLAAVAVPAVPLGIGVEDVQANQATAPGKMKAEKTSAAGKGTCKDLDFNGDGVVDGHDASFYSQNIGPVTVSLVNEIYMCLGMKV